MSRTPEEVLASYDRILHDWEKSISSKPIYSDLIEALRFALESRDAWNTLWERQVQVTSLRLKERNEAREKLNAIRKHMEHPYLGIDSWLIYLSEILE